jgi:hypothetical protein
MLGGEPRHLGKSRSAVGCMESADRQTRMYNTGDKAKSLLMLGRSMERCCAEVDEFNRTS